MLLFARTSFTRQATVCAPPDSRGDGDCSLNYSSSELHVTPDRYTCPSIVESIAAPRAKVTAGSKRPITGSDTSLP